LGGTLAMRDAGKVWLPQEDRESDINYRSRLHRSILYSGYESAIRRIAGKPFSKPVTLRGIETMPDRIQWMESDVTRDGCDLTQFARGVFEDAAAYGKTHFLVDYPNLSGRITVADEVDQSIRPYFAHIKCLDLIGWRHSQTESGATILDEIRFRDIKTAPSLVDPWMDEELRCVWRYVRTPEGVGWELYEKRQTQDDFDLVESGMLEGMPEIPLVTCYFKRTAFMEALPPLEPLAWMNLRHWQSSSDQSNILKHARVPMLAMTGVNAADKDKPTEIGVSRSLKSTNPDAKFYWVEPTGKAIEAGENDLRHIEEIMESLGAQPMQKRSGNVVATAKAIDESSVSNDAQAWIQAVENALTEGFWWAMRWLEPRNPELPEDFGVDIYSDFAVLGQGRAEDIKALQTDVGAGRVTRVRYLTEVRKRGLYGEDMDPETESEAAESEAPQIMGQVGQDEDDDFGAGVPTGGDDE
jgi:hypothetical protein